MHIPGLTESKIREHTSGGSFERGKKYLEEGAVRSVKMVGEHEIKAYVQGTDVLPYRVNIRFDDDITSVRCTCPYHGGTWCKHVAAVLLQSLRDDVPKADPFSVEEHVKDLGRDALIELVVRLAEYNPNLVDQIEREIAALSADK